MVLDLDQRGWRDLSRAVLAFLKRAEAIQERSDARREAERGEAERGEAERGESSRRELSRHSELAVRHFARADRAGAADGSARQPRPPRLP